MLSTTGTYDGCYPWDFSKFTPQIQWSTILKFPDNCFIMFYHLVAFHGIPIFKHANTQINNIDILDIPSNPTKTLKISIMLMAKPLNGSKWLVVGWHLGGTSRFFSESALDHLDLQQNATHRTNFFEGVVDGVTIPGEKKNEPMLGSTVFFHMKERGSQQRKMWNFLTLVEKKQRSDWCKQWIAAEAAERPQTNQLPKYYPDPFNLQTSSIRISHSQNTEFGDITPNTGVSFSNVSMVSWSFELEVEHWEDVLYIYIYI